MKSLLLTFLLGAGFEFGGDQIVEVQYTDGSKSNIEAGRGLLLYGGALMPLTDVIELEGRLGIKWTSVKEASNANVDWTRFPLELLGFWRYEPLSARFGGGLAYHLGNKLKGSGVASAVSADVDNALGLVFQGDYFFDFYGEKASAVSARYTYIEYEANLPGAKAVDGSSLGVAFTYYFK